MLRRKAKLHWSPGPLPALVGIAKAFVAEGAFVKVTDLQDVPGAALAKPLGASTSYSHLDVRRKSNWIFVIDSI
jgi:3(or 17)beta-hydroxysteroid dehydrogenase